MSRLTKKQLYIYSLMKWAKGFDKIQNSGYSIFGECSFCFDVNGMCGECQIDKKFCNASLEENDKSLYMQIYKKRKEYYKLIISMIVQLRRECFE